MGGLARALLECAKESGDRVYILHSGWCCALTAGVLRQSVSSVSVKAHRHIYSQTVLNLVRSNHGPNLRILLMNTSSRASAYASAAASASAASFALASASASLLLLLPPH